MSAAIAFADCVRDTSSESKRITHVTTTLLLEFKFAKCRRLEERATRTKASPIHEQRTLASL